MRTAAWPGLGGGLMLAGLLAGCAPVPAAPAGAGAGGSAGPAGAVAVAPAGPTAAAVGASAGLAEAASAVPAGPPRLSLADAVRAAQADAARRLGGAPEAFRVVEAEPVVWADGSLGCAQPGVVYTLGTVPGYRIVLQGPAGTLDYHASRRFVVHCPPGRAAPPAAGQPLR